MLNMLGVRLDPQTDRLLTTLAKRQRTTKSALARQAIRRFIEEQDLTVRAREQSVRASRKDEQELQHDDRGWTG